MKKVLFLILLIPCLVAAQHAEQGSLQVTIKGLSNPVGKVAIVLLSENEEEFGQYWLFVESDQVILTVPELPLGKYGLKFFHDENNSGKMDTNMLGIPTESFGFSNDAPAVFGEPSFDKLLFEVNGKTSIELNAKNML